MTTAPDDDVTDVEAVDLEAADVETRPDDETALADLYARWSVLVYSLALHSLGDVAQAEEVTRRVFTRAASRATTEPARTRSGWLVDLACQAVAEVRAEPGRPGAPSARKTMENSALRESKTDMLAERMVVADGMSHLDTSSRRVLQMALDRDLTLGEIAGRTGLRVEEVRSSATSSLMELRAQLEAQADAH
ncbi:MAG: sigma factor-like helix-turn-helix DNA-binding protein [Janthinobacterium lividum]